MSNQDSTHVRAGILAAIMLVSVIAISVSFAGSAAAAVESTDRTLDSDEVENGSTVTVTTNVTFDAETGDASIVENVDPAFDADNVSIISEDPGATQALYQDSSGDLVAQWGDVDSVELTYELTIPEDAAVNTTYTITGEAEDREADDDAVSIGSDTITVIESEDSVEAPGNVTIPSEYAEENGSVGSTGLLDAGSDFETGDADINTLLDVGTAFQNS